MSQFHSCARRNFPAIGIPGDVYYCTDTKEIFLCAALPSPNMVPFTGLLSGGFSLATGPAGPEGRTGPTGPVGPRGPEGPPAQFIDGGTY